MCWVNKLLQYNTIRVNLTQRKESGGLTISEISPSEKSIIAEKLANLNVDHC